jgi:hypothetical protein
VRIVVSTSPYLTPPELAKLWGCSPEKVVSLIRRRLLRAIDLNPGSLRPRYSDDQPRGPDGKWTAGGAEGVREHIAAFKYLST